MTIEYDLKINSNESGVLSIKYSIDKSLNDISNLGEEDNITPLNLSEDYLQGIIGNRNDISYKNYSIIDSGEFYTISLDLEFETINALNSVLPLENRIIISKTENETVLTQKLFDFNISDIDGETLQIFNDIYNKHYFKFTIRTPNNIINVNNALIVSNRVATYNKTFYEVLSSPQNSSWSVRW